MTGIPSCVLGGARIITGAGPGAAIVKPIIPVINAGKQALGGGRVPAAGGAVGGAPRGGVANPGGGRVPVIQKIGR